MEKIPNIKVCLKARNLANKHFMVVVTKGLFSSSLYKSTEGILFTEFTNKIFKYYIFIKKQNILIHDT